MIPISPEPFQGKVIHICKARLKCLQEKHIPFIVFLALGVTLKYATFMCGGAVMIFRHYLLINVLE